MQSAAIFVAPFIFHRLTRMASEIHALICKAQVDKHSSTVPTLWYMLNLGLEVV